MTTDETSVNRRNTRAFIAAHPTSIALVPRVRERSGSGTKFVDQPARPAQTFRLIEQGGTIGANAAVSGQAASDGFQRKAEFVLLGDADVTIGLDDYWTDGTTGDRCEVIGLLPFNGYERRALVVRYGG